MHPDIERFDAAQALDDAAICTALAEEIDRGLSGAESRIWHGHPAPGQAGAALARSVHSAFAAPFPSRLRVNPAANAASPRTPRRHRPRSPAHRCMKRPRSRIPHPEA
jgi:hypothetical protein